MLRQLILATTIALVSSTTQAADPLQVKVYNADSNSFNVTSVLVTGETEALVIDSGFTRADAYRIAANVLDSGKTLKTILISNADPDFYFGAETLKTIFPDAQVVAAPSVNEHIKAKLAAKVAFWGPKMGINAPKNPIVPADLKQLTLKVDGQDIEVRGTTGTIAHRPYVWIPSISTVAGALNVYGNIHLWMADAKTAPERQAWQEQLTEIAALKPKVVIPAHMTANTPLDLSTVEYSSEYLKRFEEEAAKAPDSAALIAAMSKAYPDKGEVGSLELGAKVVKGEMEW
ncbi:MBL fold metallo-hydrolase [Thiofilum flexile]|uniref:MBL fold metallo-hydrolase n=1 Tax=Thiofilum flexile TaxID=125627 RepID=UPI00037D9628|nr:MBL fold metallo-hydrolase [Thiofilum flexile]